MVAASAASAEVIPSVSDDRSASPVGSAPNSVLMVIASPSLRFAAVAVDLTVVLGAMAIFTGVLVASDLGTLAATITWLHWTAMGTLILGLYFALWAVAAVDTPGTRAAGLSLLTYRGDAVTTQDRLRRLAYSSFLTLVGFASVVSPLIDSHSLGWQDQWSKTYFAPRRRSR